MTLSGPVKLAAVNDGVAAPAAMPLVHPKGASGAEKIAKSSRRGLFAHLGRAGLGALNTVAVAGVALVALSYAEQPWPLVLSRDAAAEVRTNAMETAAVTTGTLPQPAAAPAEQTQPPEPPPVVIAQAPLSQTPSEPNQVAAAPAPAPTAPLGVSEPAVPPITTPPVPSNQPLSPAPKLHARETEFVAKLDTLLGSVRNQTIAVEDATRVRDAFQASNSVQAMKGLRDQIADPIAKKLVDWNLLRNGGGSARETRAFMANNPDWPNRDLLTQRAEEAMFMAGGTAPEIKGFFSAQEPKTAIGFAALASAHLAEQDEAAAYPLAARAWRIGEIPSSLESGFIERFGKLLKPDDHKWRLDRLLLNDVRWDTERKDRAAIIRRVIPYLSETEKAKANARLAVFLRSADAAKLMAALPADAATAPKNDWGFVFQLAQWHRRGGRHADAWAILKTAPTDAATAVSLDDWWEERRLAAYEALKAGKPDVAYDLVKSPGALGVNPRKDAGFMAGWLALKHLNNAKAAILHFDELEKAADGPLSRARAGYWQSQSYQALGDTAKVKSSLESAAKNPDTFYGMLAQQMLQPGLTRLAVPLPAIPSKADADRFNARDAVRAVVLARRSGLDQSVTRAFIAHLRNTLTTEPEQAMVAHLAEAVGDTQMAVRVAKSAIARGYNLITYGYPIHAMPGYQPLRPPPEPALMLAVARQESEFHIPTKSGAGARGLLQVMPVTANHVCKDYRVKCEIERLSTDPAYNAMMASAYIADRMDEFSGSYVLTLAGYNAGPGRTRQWIREFGDPRDPKVDPLDWIHRIPFEETREYVQKVLSNIQIYRARLGDEANALRLQSDLRRLAPSTKRAAAVVKTASEPN